MGCYINKEMTMTCIRGTKGCYIAHEEQHPEFVEGSCWNTWQAEAFASLGLVRDYMPPWHVKIIQDFLHGKYKESMFSTEENHG